MPLPLSHFVNVGEKSLCFLIIPENEPDFTMPDIFDNCLPGEERLGESLPLSVMPSEPELLLLF